MLSALVQNINMLATNILVLILTVLSAFDLLDMYGVNVKIFSYSKRKRAREKQNVGIAVEEYINNNKKVLKSSSEECIDYVLSSAGIKKGKEKVILSKIQDLQNANRIINDDASVSAAIHRLLQDPEVIVDLENTDPSRQVMYSGLKYYINLTDAIAKKHINAQLLSIMHYYVEKTVGTMGYSIHDIDNIVIPTESNILLGINLAELLGIDVVIMHNKRSRIYFDQYWDGSIKPGCKILIIHDVIYSAKNIEDCITHLPNSCNILGVVSLINRTDKMHLWGDRNGKALIQSMGVNVYSAINLNDESIGKILNHVNLI